MIINLTIHADIGTLLATIAEVETNPASPYTCDADSKIGKSGEVSRYQILPKVWSLNSLQVQYEDPFISTQVARSILLERITHYKIKHGPPSPYMVYILWNAPRYAYGGMMPKKIDARAKRFQEIYFRNLSKN